MKDETKAKKILVSSDSCHGCLKFDSDIMVSYFDEDDDLMCFFISNDQALKLAEEWVPIV